MATVSPPSSPRSRSEGLPNAAATSTIRQPPISHALIAQRPPRSLSRPQPSKINIDMQTVYQPSTPRRSGGNLALQARDSVTVRKRTMSSGTMSARAARQQARRRAGLLQPNPNTLDQSPSGSDRGRTPSRSPAGTPSTRTDSHRNRLSRSPSPSSSSPSQSPTPITPGQSGLSGAPSSFHGSTHVPHNSQGTTTSTYPPSSPYSSRSSSPSPERSRTPPSPPPPQKPLPNSAPLAPSLDLDPDDVNARLRLLVNNSYFLPPAHNKPELSPIYLTPTATKGATSPSAFKEFFRVGKRKDKKLSELNGYPTPSGRRGVSPADSPSAIPDDHFGPFRRGHLDPNSSVGPTRNRVVVVRETVDNLPPPAIRGPFRTSSLPTHIRPRTTLETTFIDPTTQYDVPPPTQYPSYTHLRIDAAGITGDVVLDQFAPPGEPWSPIPSSPPSLRGVRNGNGGGMDARERVWRRALLEQAVDLSLSSAASDPGHGSVGQQDESFLRGLAVDSEEIVDLSSPKSPKSKRSWWGRKDKEAEDIPQRSSTSSSNRERDFLRTPVPERTSNSVEVQTQLVQTPLHAKRSIGRHILPNVHAELEELEREHARRDTEQNVRAPPSLRMIPMPSFQVASVSAPVTPLYRLEKPPTPTLPMTALRPRPAYRRGEAKRDMPDTPGEDGRHEFMSEGSTMRKSLTSALLSDLHEVGVDVENSMQVPSNSHESLDSVAAPSLFLRDPHGVTSIVASSTTDGSHYSDDEHGVAAATATHAEQQFGPPSDDCASSERWNSSHSHSNHDEGRPSFDSFGANRVRSVEGECPARASSTFGFRQSNGSVATPSPIRGSRQDIEVDISGDPIDHLSMMESQRSVSPGGESQTSSVRIYASVLDYTLQGSETGLSMRPSSPGSQSFYSNKTESASIKSPSRKPRTSAETETPAPISFFDSVQHQSYMNEDCLSSDSDVDADEPPGSTLSHERPLFIQTLGRKSLNTTRPTPVFAMQFRNASQPQLPIYRSGTGPSLDSTYHPNHPYDLFDRKKPLSNTPLPASPTRSGILSQLKAKSGKVSRPFSTKSKKSRVAPGAFPESLLDPLGFPNVSSFSLGTGAGSMIGSDADSAEANPSGLEMGRFQGSFLSLQSSAAASVQQEQGPQDESVRRLDGMVAQHLEAEKARLRKIASAVKEMRPH